MDGKFEWDARTNLIPRPTADCFHRFHAELSHVEKIDKETQEPEISKIYGPVLRRVGTDEVRFVLNRLPPLLNGCLLMLGVTPFSDLDNEESGNLMPVPPINAPFEIGCFQGNATQLGVGWRQGKAFMGRMHWPFGFEKDEGKIIFLLVRRA